jgi:GT2 family glycosyltransferase
MLDLEIIIVSYNGEFWLKKTLSTLHEFYLKKTKKEVLVTVVDNNSSDDSVKTLKKEFKWVNLIEAKENFGFAIGNNIALKKTKAKHAMLLNSDVELTENSNFDVLVNYLEKNPKVGMVSPRVEFINGEIDPACHRGEPTLWASFSYMTGLEKLFPKSKLFAQYHQTYKDLTKTHTIDACTGAAMVVRKKQLETVGLLDERFFMYAEDLDWCKRFRDAGFSIVYNADTTIIHHKHKSGIKSSSQKIAKKTNKYFHDTMLQYYDKHYKDAYPSFIRSIIKYILVIKKGAL